MQTEQKTGIVYDIQGYSVHDGPGIRTTVYLKGCPFRCPWCHSPESQLFPPQMCYMEMRCVGVENCGTCLNVCQNGAISIGEKAFSQAQNEEISPIRVNRALCVNCGKCTGACNSQALFLSGKPYSVGQILERIRKDMPFLKRSQDGGITISGGEPLAQADFCAAVFRECKQLGLHCAVDTTGFVPFSEIEKVLPYTDLFLYDLKHMDSATHKKRIGCPNELVLANAKAIAAAGGLMQIRIPVIPGFNDSDENLAATADFCLELGQAVSSVQLLPYHRMGIVKYDRLQRRYSMPETETPSDAAMEHAVSIFAARNIKCSIH